MSGDEQEENLDRYIHEEEEEASEAVAMESVIQVKHSNIELNFCLFMNYGILDDHPGNNDKEMK